MSSVFGRLGYSSYSSSNVTDLSDSVVKQMDSLPDLLQPWQQEDMKNANVGGYLNNPVSNNITSVWTVANTIIAIPNLAQTNVSSILTAAGTLSTAANNFFGHTDRMSGLSDPPESDPTLPTYKTAIGIGKMTMYLTYQIDGVQNNAPLLGSFSSLYAKNDLITYYETIKNYAGTVANSIFSIVDSETQQTSYSSNLSQSQANTISNNLTAVANFMNTRRTADVTFYYNSRTVVDEYNTLKTFSNMGQTQTDLVTNTIGSSKLLQRINS